MNTSKKNKENKFYRVCLTLLLIKVILVKTFSKVLYKSPFLFFFPLNILLNVFKAKHDFKINTVKHEFEKNNAKQIFRVCLIYIFKNCFLEFVIII